MADDAEVTSAASPDNDAAGATGGGVGEDDLQVDDRDDDKEDATERELEAAVDVSDEVESTLMARGRCGSVSGWVAAAPTEVLCAGCCPRRGAELLAAAAASPRLAIATPRLAIFRAIAVPRSSFQEAVS